MMGAVCRLSVALAGLVLLAAVVVAGTSADGMAAAVTVRTVVGPGVLDGPGGVALGAGGDLFVADTGHCRVLVVPARAETRYGLHLQEDNAATLAGGSCAGPGSIGHPSGVAVDAQGDVYIAEATAQRVQVVRPTGPAVVTVAGTGRAGFNGDGLAGTASQLDEPTGVAVDGGGDLVIADTANCRVRVLAARSATHFGRAMRAGHLYTVAGTGVCGSAGQGGPVAAAQVWNPVAVAADSTGDLYVATTATSPSCSHRHAAGPSTAWWWARVTSASWWAGRAGTSRILLTASPRWASPQSSTTPGDSPSAQPARCSSPTGSCRSSEWCRRPPACCSGGR